MFDWIQLQEERLNLKLTWLFIAIAYIFSVSFRLFLSNYTSIADLGKTGEFINTPDGYFYAKGALDLLHPEREHTFATPTDSLIAQLTATLTKILSVNFETVVFFLPAFAAALIVIPLVLIGYSIRQTVLGFIAALVGSVAHSYYIRTQTGYFDTDMLAVVLPMVTTYLIIAGIISRQQLYLVLTAIAVTLSQRWYPQEYSLNMAIFSCLIGYTLVFDRKNFFNYQIAFFLLLGVVGLQPIMKIILSIGVYSIFYYRPQFANRFFWYLFSILFIYFAITGGTAPILGKLEQYFSRSTEITTSSINLQFYNVISTVREAGHVPFSIFAERISGHWIIFIIACIGYCLALLAYRPLFLTLPMAGLGFLAFFAGLRFTIYAAPIMALGLSYFFLLIAKKIYPSILKYTFILTLTGFVLYINYTSVRSMRYGAIFNQYEIQALNHLATLTKPNDYLVSWWDYGHPLRYFTNSHAFIDGNKHGGNVNFPVSFALLNRPTSAAHILRIAIEDDIKNASPQYIQNFLIDTNIQDPNQFLEAIKQEGYPLPRPTRNIYFILPYRMIDLINTIQLFSKIDLATGQPKRMSFFFSTNNFTDNAHALNLGKNVTINKRTWTVNLGNKQEKINQLIHTEYINDILVTHKNNFHSDGRLNLIIMKNYGTALLLDNKTLDSTFIKLFVLEETDPRYFEPIIITPLMKIFKLKI